MTSFEQKLSVVPGRYFSGQSMLASMLFSVALSARLLGMKG